jgi:hypothetical protein
VAETKDLQDWVLNALTTLGGEGTVVEVARQIWELREHDLRTSGNLFYTWQYDMRWAATQLRLESKIRAKDDSPRGTWQLI